MAIYILGWAINYLTLLMPASILRKKHGAFIALLIFSAIIILRGRVGVDTGTVYEPMVANLDSVIGTEPLFVGLLHILAPLFPTALMTVTVGLGSVLTLLLCIYLVRATEDEVFYFQAVYLPGVFLNSAISGQRSGLAFVIILLMTQCVRSKQIKTAWLLGLMAVLTHYSSILSLALWSVCVSEYKTKKQVVGVTISASLMFGILLLAQSYLESKYYLYFDTGFDKPSPASGLSVVGITGMMIFAVVMGSLPKGKKRQISLIILGALSVSWLVGLYSYSSLRFLGIIEGITPLIALGLYARYDLVFGPRYKGILAFAGVLLLGFSVKYMLAEPTLGNISSPSLPYKFYWESPQ